MASRYALDCLPLSLSLSSCPFLAAVRRCLWIYLGFGQLRSGCSSGGISFPLPAGTSGDSSETWSWSFLALAFLPRFSVFCSVPTLVRVSTLRSLSTQLSILPEHQLPKYHADCLLSFRIVADSGRGFEPGFRLSAKCLLGCLLRVHPYRFVSSPSVRAFFRTQHRGFTEAYCPA